MNLYQKEMNHRKRTWMTAVQTYEICLPTKSNISREKEIVLFFDVVKLVQQNLLHQVKL